MKKILFFLLLITFSMACKESPTTNSASKSTPSVSEVKMTDGVQSGGVQLVSINTPKGKFKVWTKKFGDNPRIKILLLHGGPAMTHEYMECFESFFPKEGFEMYEYDQLGSYYSDQPNDDDLWKTERFVEEVEQVRQALGMNKDNFYILGNSWGGILGMEYALKYQQNMKGLIISNMMASIPDYEKYNGILRGQMRKSLVDSLDVFEKKGDLKNPIYTDLVTKEYYNLHICRLPEWPDGVNRAFKHVNDHVYVLMQGPSEFKVGGRLLTWDIKNQLKNITVPTLAIGAKYDTMDPKAMEDISKSVAKGRFLYCPNGSHLCFWDDQKNYFTGVNQFIKDVDSGKF
jgi:proline iminopeptidase